MRTVIIVGFITLARAINPNYLEGEFSVATAIFLLTIITWSIVYDCLEFKNNLKK